MFTGPGLSRESGFAPFDPATMPPGVAIEDVVTRDGFARDPALVHDFYNRRRRELHAAAPNLAHEGLAALDLTRPGEVLIVTRNIDDLHERAGSRAVIHTHGELLKARCTICTKISDWFDDLGPATECPVCGNDGHLRPHVVWVGEEPLGIDAVYVALATCETYRLDRQCRRRRAGPLLPRRSQARRRPHDRIRPRADAALAEFDECSTARSSRPVPEWVRRVIARANANS